MAAGTLAIVVHGAAFVALRGDATVELGQNVMPASRVLEFVLVAPPDPGAPRTPPMQPDDWSPRAAAVLEDVTAQTVAVDGAASEPAADFADRSSLVTVGPVASAKTKAAADLSEPSRPQPTAPPIELPDEAVGDSPPMTAAASTVPPAGIRNEPPRYPRVARQRGHEGTVELRIHVLRSGATGGVEILRSSGHTVLDDAALEAAMRWRFTPATRGGRPVDLWIEMPVEFDLERDEAVW